MAKAGPDRRVALVTGASSGIGRAFAEALAARGYQLILVGRDAGRLSEVAGVLPGSEVLVADLATAAGVCPVVARLESDPAIDVLVNNAGFGIAGDFPTGSDAREQELVGVNCAAVVSLTRAVVPIMRQRGSGTVINVASELGLRPAASMAVYGASKAFVVSFSCALAEELEGSGVRVQALCPGLTRTRFAVTAGLPEELHRTGWDPDTVVEQSLQALSKAETICVPAAHASLVRRGLRRAKMHVRWAMATRRRGFRRAQAL